MKIFKRLIILMFSVLAAAFIFPVTAFAAGSIDLSQDVGLTISYQDGNTPIVGAKFDIFLVATVDEYGELTAAEDFAQFNVNIKGKNDEAWQTLASTLEGYVLRDQILPDDSGKTNDKGLLSFPTDGNALTPGLYLVLGHRHTQDGFYYDAKPFMVMLPGIDKEKNQWVYNVTANVKFDSTQIPDSPDESTITRKVLKVWEDKGYENNRPREIIVQLLRNDKVYDTVTLNAENNWRYTWTGLNGVYKWTVVEKELEGYTVAVVRENITFVITNTFAANVPDKPVPTDPTDPAPPKNPEQPSNPALPQTGQLWWPVPVLLIAGMLLVVAGMLRRRGIKDEK